MRDPALSLARGRAVLHSTDSWDQQLSARFTESGAFPLGPGSRDAAAEVVIGAGDHVVTAQPISGSGGGTVLVELYQSPNIALTERRFINVSARGPVADGAPLIVGFTISGDVPMKVMIRGIGPSLSKFGVSDSLPDANLVLYRGPIPLYENEDWALQNPTVARLYIPDLQGGFFVSDNMGSGAFPLDLSSLDAIIVATLAPGSYTAVVRGTRNVTGTALVEVYEIALDASLP